MAAVHTIIGAFLEGAFYGLIFSVLVLVIGRMK